MNRLIAAVAAALIGVAATAGCTERIDEMPEPMPNQTSPEAPRG